MSDTKNEKEKKVRKPRVKTSDLQKQIADLGYRLAVVQKAHEDALQNYGKAVEMAAKFKGAAQSTRMDSLVDRIRLLDSVLAFFMNVIGIDKDSIVARLELLQKQREEQL